MLIFKIEAVRQLAWRRGTCTEVHAHMPNDELTFYGSVFRIGGQKRNAISI